MNEGGWATVVIAGLGLAGTVAAGAFGYQAGTAAVNKDYVQIAVTNLDRKDASPELRKWSVDVLNRLSPVPFGRKLEGELSNRGLGNMVYIQPVIPIPKGAEERCPDIVRSKIPNEKDPLVALATEYEDCRLRLDRLANYLVEIHKISIQAKVDADSYSNTESANK